MPTKTVDMAVRDPANAQRFVTESTPIEVVKVSVRNRDKRPAGRDPQRRYRGAGANSEQVK